MNVFLKFCDSSVASLSVQMENRDLIYLSINPQHNWTYRKKVVPEDTWSNIKLPPNVCWICHFCPVKLHCVRTPLRGKWVLSVRGRNLHKTLSCFPLLLPLHSLWAPFWGSSVWNHRLCGPGEEHGNAGHDVQRDPFVCSFQLQPSSCSCIS